MRARCGGGAAAWVAGVLAAPGTQGGWWLGQQEIQCSRRVWQPVLANMLQYSCLEKLFSETEVWQAAVYWVAKSWTGPKPPCVHKHMIPPDPPPHLWQLCPSEVQVWRWCSCLGCRGSGSTRYSGELVAKAAENTVV